MEAAAEIPRHLPVATRNLVTKKYAWPEQESIVVSAIRQRFSTRLTSDIRSGSSRNIGGLNDVALRSISRSALGIGAPWPGKRYGPDATPMLTQSRRAFAAVRCASDSCRIIAAQRNDAMCHRPTSFDHLV